MTVVEGKLACRGNCEQEVARERRLLEQSERSLAQRSIIFQTSGGVYHRSFALSALFGFGCVGFGALLLLTQVAVLGAVLIGIGIIYIIHAIGLARASRSYKALAAEERQESNPNEHSR